MTRDDCSIYFILKNFLITRIFFIISLCNYVLHWIISLYSVFFSRYQTTLWKKQKNIWACLCDQNQMILGLNLKVSVILPQEKKLNVKTSINIGLYLNSNILLNFT